MSRTTIDFGIDLGTTNSAIAVLRGTIIDIIKNDVDHDITASAVSFDKRGQQHVGVRAKNYLENEKTADDVYIEFKRRMGTSHEYLFKSANRKMLPEDLSAEVLKNLRGDVQQRLGEVVQAAVITVPAAFQQNQCLATKRAGELAGLLQCPLVQEPVAAALAYGFQAETKKSYWLIYDFGGGTFDAAIMRAEDGTISVVNHGGDNFLGGSDIDWAVVEQIVVPALVENYNLPDFSRGNKRWRTAFAVIKRSVESAKIQLSRSETAYLEDCRFKDADGEEIEIDDLKLTRSSLVGVAEPIIMRSIDISKRVLKEKNLAPSSIERVILVGGPTLASYFREILKAGLGIPLDFTVDPLTVVARGAAVFAGTQRLATSPNAKAAVGQFNIDLKYKPIGADEDPTVRGTVSGSAKENVEGFAIEFVNEQTHWRSGKVLLKENGNFKLNLLAEKGCKNSYVIELIDKAGRKQAIVPDRISYTIGLAISEQPIINSIGVALANNEVDVFFRKGEPLPAKATRIYKTIHAVRKGSDESVLNVPVVEGEVELADRNRLLTRLVIKGGEVRRDVPAGSEVEVTLLLDTSRILKMNAYIPILDEEFESTIDSIQKANPDPKHLHQEFEAELSRLKGLRNNAHEVDDNKIDAALDEVDSSGKLEEIERLIEDAKADPDAANIAEKRLLEIKVRIDRAEDALKWPALVNQANQALDQLDEMVNEHGDDDQKERAIEFRKEIEDLIKQKRSEPLRRKIEQAFSLYREMLFKQPGFWLGYFNHLIDQRGKMKDQDAAERLIDRGQEFIANGNVQGLRSVVSQLLGLLPDDVAEQIQRGYQSGLLR